MLKRLEKRLKPFVELSARECYDILHLRETVFQLEQNCFYQDIDYKDMHAHLLYYYLEEKVVATARILPPDTNYQGYSTIGRVCSHASTRGTGLGAKLRDESITACLDLYPHIPIKISAQSYLLNFYTQGGFVATGPEYLEDDIPHTAMIYTPR